MNIALFQIANRKKRNSTLRIAFQNAMELDQKRVITILNVIHLLVIILYYTLTYLLYNTTIFGSDRTQMAVRSITTSFIAYHCVLNYFFTERVKAILKSTIKRSNKPKIGMTSLKATQALDHKTNIVNIVDRNNFPMELLVANADRKQY